GRVRSHGDERVLERYARAQVRVDVAGGHARHAEALGQLRELTIATAIAAAERPLELDPHALRAKRAQQAAAHGGGLRVTLALDPPRHRALARAARQADEPVRVALDVVQPHGRRLRVGRPIAGALVRAGDQPAEVAVAGAVLA